MAVVGEKRENAAGGFVRKVGLAVCEPFVINPTNAQIVEFGLGKEKEQEPVYTFRDNDGNKGLILEIWMREKKTQLKFKLRIKLVDKVQTSEKDGTTKYRFIDTKGNTSYWVSGESGLADWMQENNPHVARIGEVDMYRFLRSHQGELKPKSIGDFTFDWNKLMKGNVKELNDLKHNMFVSDVLVLLCVRVDNREEEVKNFQSVYNRAFLPGDFIRYFRVGDKGQKKLNDFLREITDPIHGCHDFFGKDGIVKEMHDYVAEENPLTSDSPVLANHGSDEDDPDSDVAISTDY